MFMSIQDMYNVWRLTVRVRISYVANSVVDSETWRHWSLYISVDIDVDESAGAVVQW